MTCTPSIHAFYIRSDQIRSDQIRSDQIILTYSTYLPTYLLAYVRAYLLRYLQPLGPFQKLNLGCFFGLYILYIFLSLILLLNLLIALLGHSFSKTQEDATLQGRMAFALKRLTQEHIHIHAYVHPPTLGMHP